MSQTFNNPIEYRSKPSNSRVLLASLIVLVLAVVFACAYAFVINSTIRPYMNGFLAVLYIFLAIANIVSLVAFTVGLGKITLIAGRIGHIRNGKTLRIMALVFSVLFFLVTWAFYFNLISGDPAYDTFFFYLQKPWLIFADMPSAFEWKADVYPVPFSMKAVILCSWIIEAGLILYLPFHVVKSALHHPYSEKGNQWYEEFVLYPLFERVAFKKPFLEEIEKDHMNAVGILGKGDIRNHARIHIYYHEAEDTHYLSVVNVIQSGQKANKDRFIHLWPISKQEANHLLETHRYKKNHWSFL